jgi:hypothetical protein
VCYTDSRIGQSRKDIPLSVLEELRAVEERIVARLGELQPVVEEYEELRRVAERLGIEVVPPSQRRSGGQSEPAPTPSAPAAAAPARKPAARSKRAAAPRARRRSGPARASRASDTRTAGPGGTRAKGAERREQVVDLIRARPGITVPDVSQELGLEPPPVYRVVRKLQAAGVIVKEGKSLRLA